MHRRNWLVALMLPLVIAGVLALRPNAAETLATVDVYKTPTCGCCQKWIALLEQAGYAARVHNQDDVTDVKVRHGIPSSLRSCHTAVVDGFVFEGHVPLDLLRQVLSERPPIAGLIVPGMPVGSPGMEAPGRKDSYDVLALGRDGGTRVFARR